MKKILFVLFIFLVVLLCYAQEPGISKQNNVRDIFGSVYRAGTDQTFPVADSGSIFLMRKGEKISETVSVNNEAKIHLPYDLPSGDYYLENVLGEKVVEFQVEGISPQVPKREVNIKEISLIFPNKIKAGKTINAELIISFAGETFSEKLILIFEKSKDVAYFGTAVSFDRDKKSVSVDIPETMPKGEYTVYYMTDKDVAENMGSVKVNVESTYTEKNTPLKPIAYGFFKDTSGAVQIWYTNQAFTLYWAGEPMYKTSGMLNGDYMTVDRDGDWDRFVKNIDSLEAHGIKHVYLYTQTAMRQRPLYKWETIMDYLETRGFTYTIGNPVGNWDLYKKEMKGWIVRANPANMKLEKNVKNGHTSLIKTTDIYFTGVPIYKVNALVLDRNGNFIDLRPCEIISGNEGKTEVTVKPDLSGIEGSVNLCYSVLADTGMIDFFMNVWEAKQKQTDYLKKEIDIIGFRPGFRGYVDLIMPNERGIHMGVESIFYIQEEFNEKRTEQLKEKYKNIASLKKAWKVRGDFVDTIEEASVLYPVYNLGDELLLSDGFDTDKVYVLEGSSVFWYEYLEMRDMAYVNAQNDMIDAVKEKMDVPVTIKMVISGKKYNVNYNKSRKGFDAAGFELYNTDDLLMNYGVGYRYGEMLSSFKAGFAASTEINKTATENMYPNYPDIHSFFYDMSVTHMFGAKLTYLFLLDLDSMNPEHEQFPHNRSLRDQRMLEWMKLWEEILNDKKELIENYKPYVYNSWPQADCTWPQYSERDAVRSVDDAYGTANVKAENGVWVINTQKADVGCDITFVTLNNNPGVEFYKDEFNKLLSKKGHETVMLGLRYNLGDLSVDKYYKNEFFEDEEYKYQVLNVPRGAEVIRKTEGKVWGMKIGNLQIVACEPKYCNSIEDSIQFAKVPKPKTDMPYNAKDYAEKLLGIKFATFGNNHYKAVGYTLKGKDEVLIHTTKKEDRDILRFTAPKDFILEQYRDTPETLAFSPENAPIDYDYPSLKKESREYKKGDTVEISFPITPVSDENVGAGKGSVRFVGLSLDDIEFENTEKDSPFTEKNETFGISGLAEGLTMPKAEKITDPGMSHTEAMKAMVAHNRAIDLIEQGKYQKALDLLREFQGCAQPKMLESYYLLLGTACLYLGYPYDAVSYFGDLLRNIPGSQKVKCALGCAYWNTDREKAVSLWKETSDLLESQANLEFANNQ